MSNSDTEIETYLTYEDVLSEVQKGTLALPLSHFDDERSIDNLIHELGEIRQGDSHYVFSYYMSEKASGLVRNSSYKGFFDFQRFLTQLSD